MASSGIDTILQFPDGTGFPAKERVRLLARAECVRAGLGYAPISLMNTGESDPLRPGKARGALVWMGPGEPPDAVREACANAFGRVVGEVSEGADDDA